MRGGKRFSIFDAMQEAGVFDRNPANTYARDNEGMSIYQRQEYPKLLYHPKGEERVIVPAQAEVTPFGPKMLGEQREIINKTVNNAEEEKSAVAMGWHLHPAQAVEARNRFLDEHNDKRAALGLSPLYPMAVPAVSSEGRVKDLEAELAAKIAELERLKAMLPEAEVATTAAKAEPLVDKLTGQRLI